MRATCGGGPRRQARGSGWPAGVSGWAKRLALPGAGEGNKRGDLCQRRGHPLTRLPAPAGPPCPCCSVVSGFTNQKKKNDFNDEDW